jgi:hypothetical protein
MSILRGHDAINAARALGCTLSKYADAVDNARANVTVTEAEEIAREDAGLLFLELVMDDAPDFDDAETFGREAW